MPPRGRLEQDAHERTKRFSGLRLPVLRARGISDNSSQRENEHLEYKSLRLVQGKRADFDTIVRECVGFANSRGGQIIIGIEDGQTQPPRGQRVREGLRDLVVKRVQERAVNINIEVSQEYSTDFDAYFLLLKVSQSQAIASTSDGRFYKRYADRSIPLQGDQIGVLLTDRAARPWELLLAQDLTLRAIQPSRAQDLIRRVRASPKVSPHIKEKSTEEVFEHYKLSSGNRLTRLGVLWLGSNFERAALGTATVLQMGRYNTLDERLEKFVWNAEHNPVELIEGAFRQLRELCRGSFEVPSGLGRLRIKAYDDAVLRELIVNAVVHRPYTQRGDIFVNVYPDRLEVINPGSLPPGVTAYNMLHRSQRRNDALAGLLDHLGLMEQEGSGIDMLYERLLVSGRVAPQIEAGDDFVKVTIWPAIARPSVTRIMARVEENFILSQRNRLVLAVVSGADRVTASQLAAVFSLSSVAEVSRWTRNLLNQGLVSETVEAEELTFALQEAWTDV